MKVDIADLRRKRIEDPDAITRAASERAPSSPGSRLMLIAADHPARGSIAARGRATAMADRGDLLERLVEALAQPGVDGVLGTADILEDLLLLGALDGKVVFGSMNRGGLAGAVFELDDRFTAYDGRTLSSMGFDGGKMLVRIALDEPETADTLESAAGAVNDLAEFGLKAMVEPFMSERREERLTNILTTDAVIKSVVIASGLGATSRHTWLKLPVVDEMERVMTATTLPTLLLGGDPKESDDAIYQKWADALALPGVQGLVVGRALLYPNDDDVTAAVEVATKLVHG